MKDNHEIAKKTNSRDSFNLKCLRCLSESKAKEKYRLLSVIISYGLICALLGFMLLFTYAGCTDDGIIVGIISILIVKLTYRIATYYGWFKPSKRLERYLISEAHKKRCMMESCQVEIEHQHHQINDSTEMIAERVTNDLSNEIDEKCLRCLAKKRLKETLHLLKRVFSNSAVCILFVFLSSTYVDDWMIGFFFGVKITIITTLMYRIVSFLFSRFKSSYFYYSLHQSLIEATYKKLKVMEPSQIEREYKRL